MNYLVKKIEANDVLDFFFNPFANTAQFKTYIFQKYPKNEYVDSIVYIDPINEKFYQIAYVHYGLGKLFLDNAIPLGLLMIDERISVSLQEVRDEAHKLKEAIIKDLTIEKEKELEETSDYKRAYDYYERKVYDKLIFSKMGTCRYNTELISFANFQTDNFFNKLDILDLIAIYEGDLKVLRKNAEKRVFSYEHIISEVIMPLFEKRADDYIGAGKFTEREEQLIYFLDKIKEIKAASFNVESMHGRKGLFRNKVSYDGSLYMVEASFLKLDFQEVKTIEVDGNIVYEKEDMTQIKERVKLIIESGALLR